MTGSRIAAGAQPPARKLPVAWLWGATIVVALWIGGRLTGPSAAPAAASAAPAGERAAASGPVAAPGARGEAGPDAAEIRAIIRDELAHRLAEPRRASAEPEPGEPAAPPPLTAEHAARADEASAVIDHAIGAGRWTADDRARFARAIGELPPPVAIELERRLHIAINRGTVAIADGAPPFGPPVPAP